MTTRGTERATSSTRTPTTGRSSTRRSGWSTCSREGSRPRRWRAVNLLLHMANVALLWGLLRRLGVPGAAAVALLWAVHPGHFAAASLILHRKDVLSATSVLAALWLWFPLGRATPTLGWGRVSGVAAITMAGVLVKTPIALLPCYVAIVILVAERGGGALRRSSGSGPSPRPASWRAEPSGGSCTRTAPSCTWSSAPSRER